MTAPRIPPRPDSVRKSARAAVVQGGDPARGHDDHREPDPSGQPDEAGRRALTVEEQNGPDHEEQKRQEPGDVAEKLEEEIGDPGADHPPPVDDVFGPVADRPALIAPVIARDREREEDRDRREPDEGCFAPPSAERLGEQP